VPFFLSAVMRLFRIAKLMRASEAVSQGRFLSRIPPALVWRAGCDFDRVMTCAFPLFSPGHSRRNRLVVNWLISGAKLVDAR
jgi:hypothetical protein